MNILKRGIAVPLVPVRKQNVETAHGSTRAKIIDLSLNLENDFGSLIFADMAKILRDIKGLRAGSRPLFNNNATGEAFVSRKSCEGSANASSLSDTIPGNCSEATWNAYFEERRLHKEEQMQRHVLTTIEKLISSKRGFRATAS